MPAPSSLTPKQARFLAAYIAAPNAAKAARAAGYSARTANRAGSRLLSNVVIRAALTARQAAIEAEGKLTSGWIIDRLKIEATREAAGGGTHSARVAALTALAKILGMLTERVPFGGEVKVDSPALDFSGVASDELRQLDGLRERVVRTSSAPAE